MKRLFQWLFRLIEGIVFVVSVIMCLVVFFQVILRYILDQPFGWTEELGRITFLIFVMLGAALAYRDNRHLGLDILEIRLPYHFRLFSVAIKRILVIIFAVVMIQQGINLVNSLFAKTPILGIHFSDLYLIFPFTMALILILAVIQLYKDIRQIMQYWQSGGKDSVLSPSGGYPANRDKEAHLD
jgi:TRAP-type C4-dicarboxylate transport system permease small subunit